MYSFIKQRWGANFGTYEGMDAAFDEYNCMDSFKANENINEIGNSVTEEVFFVMRMATQFHLTAAFEAMKIDMTDPNIMEDLNTGNIGTPGRIAKIWVGADLNETSELGHGRWVKPPRLATFPNNNDHNFVIEKTIELTSSCSHHFVPFSTLYTSASHCTVKYIPKDTVIGISKLSRYINDFVAKRFYLQEDLTKNIGEFLQQITGAEDVYVKLFALEHGCEKFRGARDSEGSMTTEFKTGRFLNEK